MMGVIQRVMRFQSSFKEIGMTGWKFMMYCVTLLGPTSKLKLFWKGTLIMLATGFCAILANSSALSPPLSSPSLACPPPPPCGWLVGGRQGERAVEGGLGLRQRG